MSYNTELQNNNQELRGILEDVNELPEASSGGNIPEWALQPEKPSYSKGEVGLGNVDNVRQYSASNPPPYPVTSVNKKTGDVTVTVPSKTSELENDSGFIKSNEAPVQSVNGKAGVVTLAAGDVGARPSTWTPTYSDVGADKSGTASSAVSSHNTNTDAHNDIRLLIAGLTEKLNALANSTDDDLDQMAEIVAYIKANKTLIDSITSSKVSVADVVNNLTSNVANKPLSAAQGVVLKALIDAITVPTKVSQLTNDKGYLTSYTETDPTVPSWAKQSSKPRYNANEVGAVAYTAQNLTDAQKAQARANIAALGKSDISLGIASDGLIYVFINGQPVGTGIPQGQSGDVFGYVDENNTIVLNGNLADGTYSVKYEMEDGSTVDIGNLVLSDGPILADFTNLFDASNVVLNSRTNSSGGTTSYDGVVISNFIDISSKVPFAANTKIYIKGADFDATDTRASKIATYKNKPSSGYSGSYSEAIKPQMTINDEGNGVISVTIGTANTPSDVKYMLLTMRVKDTAITADDIKDIIVTIDEPIYK